MSADLFGVETIADAAVEIVAPDVVLPPWRFGALQPFCADLIMADPPWEFLTHSDKGHAKGAQAHYDCMNIEDIKALPVIELARGDCWLFLWVTAPMLPEGLDVLRAWGFRYTTTIAWHKVFRSGKTAMGTGYVARSMHENILIGKVGDPKCARALPSLFQGIRRQHSRKPEEVYKLLDVFAPQAFKLDLFSRERRAGWLSFGDEAEKFNREDTTA